MHIEALKVFCDLVETQAITLAAERNFVTPSAIRQQIRSLETKFTKKLLDRQNGRHELSVTPTGQAFYRQCKRVLAGFDELQNEMCGPGGSISSRVRVAADYCVGLYDLPPKLGAFMRRFPAARIDLEYGRSPQIVRDVLDGTIDLGVVAFPEQHSGLTCAPIDGGKMILICSQSHEFADRAEIYIDELSERDLVLFERGMPTRKATDRIFRSHGVQIGKTVEFGNIETIKNAVEVGLGLAIVPRRSVLDEERSKRLAVVPIAGMDWERTVGAIFPAGKTLPYAAKKFIQVLEDPERSH